MVRFFFFLGGGKLFVILIAVFVFCFFFSLSVTLPGTHAGRSALTRGKPIFLCLFPADFLGLLCLAWVCFLFGVASNSAY